MNIHLIAVGNIKETFYKDACHEYLKRLGRFARVQVSEASECRGQNGRQDLEKEGALLLKKQGKGGYSVALCVEGEPMSSEEFADLIQTASVEGGGLITFFIGGSDGLSDAVKQSATRRISFSKMTFPHQLMRVILLEQIYRAYKILGNESYHK